MGEEEHAVRKALEAETRGKSRRGRMKTGRKDAHGRDVGIVEQREDDMTNRTVWGHKRRSWITG